MLVIFLSFFSFAVAHCSTLARSVFVANFSFLKSTWNVSPENLLTSVVGIFLT